MRNLYFIHYILNILLYTFVPFYSYGNGEAYFDSHMLHIDKEESKAIDLSVFIETGYQPEGTYEVDVYINSKFHGKNKLLFLTGEDGKLHAIVDMPTLISFGIKEKVLHSPEKGQRNIAHYVDGAYDELDLNKYRLNIRLPQAVLKIKNENVLHKENWDDGVNAAFVNYTMNQSIMTSRGSGDSIYLNLGTGINFTDWRLRNNLYYRSGYQTSGQWFSRNFYASKNLTKIDSIFRTGDDTTPNDIFDSIQYRGFSLYSDSSMLPSSRQGYAPIVRGIASSDALVTIKQGDYVIYEQNVPPGPFEITDLNNAIAGKMLDVTVIESNGEVKSFQQGVTAIPIMLREGMFQYSSTIGKHSNHNYSQKDFLQGTISYGLPYELTLYGGNIYSKDYTNFAFGFGKNIGLLGAISFDMQASKSQFKNEAQYSGQSFQMKYLKNFDLTSTTLNISLTQDDKRFFNFSDAPISKFNNKKRTDMHVSMSQPTDNWGTFYLSGNQKTFFGQKSEGWNINSGYSANIRKIIYSANLSYNKTPGFPIDKQLFFDIKIPLDTVSNNTWANYKLLKDNLGRELHLVGVNGIVLDNKNLRYSLQKSMGNYRQNGTERASANYQSSFSKLSGEYSQGTDGKLFNYNAQGAIVAHPYGITFSQPLGETAILVRAPDASDVKLQYRDGLHTDYRGYAIIPYANHYRDNYISIDPRTLKENVELDSTSQTVIPTRGAIALADFRTRLGAKVLMKVHYNDGYPPFGAVAEINGIGSGIVAADGELYLVGVPDEGNVTIVWEDNNIKKCHIHYRLPTEKEHDLSTYLIDVECH